VAAFSLDAAGKLTPVPGSPFPTGGKTGLGCCVVVHPTGKFLYVEDTANVYAFTIDTSTGALTLTNTVSGPKQGSGLALDPTGSLLYAVGAGSNSVETFTVNSTTGAISLFGTSPLSLQNGGYAILVHPSGRFAYTVEGGQMLVAYSLQGGVLTSLAKYSGALGSQQLAIDASDTFLYAPQTGTANSISGFRIEALGTLTPLPGSPTVSGRTPVSITITSR
jgi:6-phosphogluconolactonase (cycloisomerase 2 family)